MANYNYTTLDEVLAVINHAVEREGEVQRIKSTRGDYAAVEFKTWQGKDGKMHSRICIEYSHGFGSYNMEESGRVEVVEAILVALNCRLKIGKEYKRLFRDVIRVNNPAHPLYNHIVDIASGEVIL